MPPLKRKISLIYFVIITLLLVGLVPIMLTGWFLSDKSARELRAAENRYQIQLVQEKGQQIEMFGKRFSDMVGSIADSLELSNDVSLLSAPRTEQKLASILRENTDLLALNVQPASGEALSVFRAENIAKTDVQTISDDVARSRGDARSLNGATKTIPTSGEPVMVFASRVMINGAIEADVVAVVSLKNIQRSVVGIVSTKKDDLWEAGLPIIFVVDANGSTVFHPDPQLSFERRSLGSLKIVDDWLEAGTKVQSALVPFTAEYKGKNYEMIGAYSTVNLGNGTVLGVITMQDESKALASVDEMRSQTWLISMAFALFALVAGFVGARFMTAPLLNLVAAAKKIGAGDFEHRVETRNWTEIGTLGETFNSMTDKIEEQIANLAKAAEENRELFVGTVKALAAAIDGKDKYTRGHSERVARISVAIGRRMGMGEDELETLRMSALLHDIGKIAIDDAILKKPAALTDEEYEIMKTHPQRGYKIMSQIPAMKDFLPGMYMHHEMVNGKGYPQGLTGDQIPLQAKIVSVADTFDAMTIDRPYQMGMDLASSLERLRSFVNTRYQPEVVEALIDACNAGEVANGIVRQMAEKRAIEESLPIPKPPTSLPVELPLLEI
jgi:HD-GYP domain-containing protein (c-di-GMP phosphodiesterase class II)